MGRDPDDVSDIRYRYIFKFLHFCWPQTADHHLSLQELIEKYGKGELSTEQAANKVGLALPRVPPHPEGWAPLRLETRLFPETRLFYIDRCHDNRELDGTTAQLQHPLFEVQGDVQAGPPATRQQSTVPSPLTFLLICSNCVVVYLWVSLSVDRKEPVHWSRRF